MKICPKCEGHTNSTFCTDCGNKTILLYCPKCVSVVLKHSKFCGSCGTDLTVTIAKQLNEMKGVKLERQG